MTDSLFSVDGKVVLVSGGSRGIGRAIADGFAQRGAQVIITGRERETLEATASEMSSGGNTVHPIVCDVSNVDAIHSAVQQSIDKFGRIDTLINVAGVNIRKPTLEYTPEEYDFIVDINLKGAFLLSQAVGEHMIKQGSGSQINISSLNTARPMMQVLPYAMSKSGLEMMTRGLATEWGPHGVRVNALAPGFTLTDLSRKLFTEETMNEWIIRNTPVKRLGQSEDMIGTAIFLASDASEFMTGQILYVDGGVSAGSNWPITG